MERGDEGGVRERDQRRRRKKARVRERERGDERGRRERMTNIHLYSLITCNHLQTGNFCDILTITSK